MELSEKDLQDIEDNDTTFFAAAAFANRPWWPTRGSTPDAAARREFWLWLLTEAVPAACDG